MYAYLMAVSASGTQRQDRDFYRGVPATGKAVCVADTSPHSYTPTKHVTHRSSVEAYAPQTKRAGGGKRKRTKAWRNADDGGDAGKGCAHTPFLSR
jgi:hypothetical protein